MSRPSELAGLKVAHDFDEFVEGREVVLTLQDQLILNNGSELNDDLDTLHNVELTENFKVEFYNKLKENIKKGDYDEDRFDSLEKKPILSKYDEQKPEKKGILLDAQGTFDLEKKSRLELIKNRLSGKSQKFVDLSFDKVVASDYKPKEEPKVFKKPKAVKKDKKKMKQLIDFLEENAEETIEDYGNRDKIESKKRKQELEDLAEKRQKVENYEGALNRAVEQNKESLKRNIEEENEKNSKEIVADLDEFDELERALERQRRMLQNKKKPVEESVKDLMESNILLEREKIQLNKELNIQDFNQMIKEERDAKEGDKQSIRTIITATEFLKNVKTEKELNENQMKINAPTPLNLQNSRNGTASVVNISLPTEKLIGYNKNGLSSVMNGSKSIFNRNANKQNISGDDIKKETKESDSEYSDFEKAHEEIKFLEEDPVGDGLAGTLKNLRERGYLMDMEFSGRTNDALLPEDKNERGKAAGDRIKLEYRDGSGKLMTPKEAYRYMCWTFHGKKPGKKKMEKRLKKEKLEQKIKSKPLQEMPLMKALAKSQEKSTQPHLILTKKD